MNETAGAHQSTPQRAFALVGVSVHSVEAAVRAARLGADYLQVTYVHLRFARAAAAARCV